MVELKSGRIHEGVIKQLGYWKVEEFQTFTYPATEYVHGVLLPDANYHAWTACVCIYH